MPSVQAKHTYRDMTEGSVGSAMPRELHVWILCRQVKYEWKSTAYRCTPALIFQLSPLLFCMPRSLDADTNLLLL
jgi:hypothetical protein